MDISIKVEGLLEDIQEDLILFGSDFEVYAVYSLREVEGQDFEYISSYVDATKPARDETETKEEYQEVLEGYEKGLKSLENTKHKKMTLAELELAVKNQEKFIR